MDRCRLGTLDAKEASNQQPVAELPFILDFLEHRDGAMAGTTSGVWTDIDCFDWT